MKRNLLFGVVIVSLVAVWTMWHSGGNADAQRAMSIAGSRPTTGDPPSPLAEVPDPIRERSELRTPDAGAEASLVAPPPPGRGIDVVVIDAMTRALAPGAEVLSVDAPEIPAFEGSDRLRLCANTVIEWIDADGERFTADEQGRVRLPENHRRRTLFARLGDRRGAVIVNSESTSPVWLEIHRDFDVVVRVVDEAGIPLAGVPVALSVGNDWAVREEATAITEGVQGLATLHHVGLALAVEADERGFVSLAGLFDPPVQLALDPHDPPRDPVTLVAPSSGELEIILQHADGSPDIENARLRLQIVRVGLAEGQDPYSTEWLSSMHDGRIVIPHVILKSRFRADVSRAGTNLHAIGIAAGPTLPGQRATLTIQTEFSPHESVLVARLLDEQGHPLASKSILFGTAFGEPPMGGSSSNLATDRSGRIRFSIDGGDDAPPTEVFFGQWDAQGRKCVALARAPLRTRLPVGVTDLGDIVLTSGPLIVAGRAVDEDGRPIAGARVSIEFDGSNWSGFWSARTRGCSDESGRFEVHGLIWAERFFAFAEVGDAQSPRTPFESGSTDVSLVLARTGEIAGAIQLPLSVRASELSIVTQRESDGRYPRRAPDIEPNGAIRLRGLLPGAHGLTIGVEREHGSLLKLAGLSVVGGATLRPPELNPLDLRTRVHLHGLTARDPDGKSISILWFTWRPAGQTANEGDASDSVASGRARIVSLLERIDVDVSADRMRTARVKDLTGEREIVMQRAVRVRLKLRDGVPLPDAPFTLAPILASLPGSPNQRNWTATSFSPARESFLDASESCRREVHFIVFKDGEGWPEAKIRPSVPQFVTITDEPAEQVFEVSISEAELQRGIAAYPR